MLLNYIRTKFFKGKWKGFMENLMLPPGRQARIRFSSALPRKVGVGEL